MVKTPLANAGDPRGVGSIPRWEKLPGVGNGNLFQCSCVENSMDRGAWQAAVHGVAKESDTTERLRTVFHCIYVPHLFYLFICQGTYGLLPCLGCDMA